MPTMQGSRRTLLFLVDSETIRNVDFKILKPFIELNKESLMVKENFNKKLFLRSLSKGNFRYFKGRKLSVEETVVN